MKRTLLAVVAIAIGVTAARLDAKDVTAAKSGNPDWRYRWHEGRWWYWMPESKWMVWSGSTWLPYEQFSRCANVSNAGQAKPYTAGYGSYDAQTENTAAQPAYSGGGSRQQTYTAGRSDDSAGYGWSWGPGTAYRNGPGRRF